MPQGHDSDNLSQLAHDLTGCMSIFMAVQDQLHHADKEAREIFSEALDRLKTSVEAVRRLSQS